MYVNSAQLNEDFVEEIICIISNGVITSWVSWALLWTMSMFAKK